MLHSLLHFITSDWEYREVGRLSGIGSKIKMRRCLRCGEYQSWFYYDSTYTPAFQHEVRAWEEEEQLGKISLKFLEVGHVDP